MISIPLAKLQAAAPYKPQGYLDACLATGRVVGGNLELTEAEFDALRSRFSPPPIVRQVVAATTAVIRECGAALSGQPAVDDNEKARRLAICEACPNLIPQERRCAKCGCFVELKASFRTQACPEDRWALTPALEA